MFPLALKSILANKVRMLSTSLAVVLGVAFLSGTLVFTDTIRRSFDDLFADVFDETDAYVRSATEVDLGFGQTQRGRMPADVVDAVRGVDGVADVQPVVQGYAQLVGADGEVVGDPGRGAPTFAMTYISGRLSPWELTRGSREPGSGEIVVDRGTADKGGVEIGDEVVILTQTGPHRLTLVGTATFGAVASPGGASAMLVDLPTSQQILLDGADEIDAVMIDAMDGVDQETLTRRVDAALADDVEALTGAEIIAETQDAIGEGLAFLNTFLLVFAVIGLVVGAFTIYNTFQIVVSHRAREMALLRAVGASRRQVMAAQLIEALVIGIVASVVGFLAGIGFAQLLRALLDIVGVEMPGSGAVISTRTVLASVLVGTIVTVAAATLPAVRASRIPPLAVIRAMVVGDTPHTRSRFVSGCAVTALGAIAYAVGLARSELVWIGVGALVTFVGIFVLGPLLARPAARALGAPLDAGFGVAGELAQQNAIRNPKRTARTGGALMVGVALVAAITVIAASVHGWARDVVGEQFTGDFVVSTSMYNYGGLSPRLTDEITALPEVAVATGVRVGAAHDVGLGRDLTYVAVEPATAGALFDIGLPSDDLARLSPGGVLLDDGEAADRGAEVGDRIVWTFLDGRTETLEIEGIFTEDDLAGPVVVSHELHERSGVDQFDFSVYVAGAAGVGGAEVARALEAVVDAYPNADVESKQEYMESQAAQIDPILNLMYALLALAVIIALVNIANSLSLSIHERERELALLRAVGMSRGQTRRCVEFEAILVAVIGTLTGIVVGTFFGWSISIVGRGASWNAFVLPVQSLAIIVVLALAGASLSALRPARRASRLDILQAIASE